MKDLLFIATLTFMLTEVTATRSTTKMSLHSITNHQGSRSHSFKKSERLSIGKCYACVDVSNRYVDGQEVIDDLLLGYDARIAPNYEEDFPVEVVVQINILTIDSVRESDMDYSIGMFLRQSWNDSRLKYPRMDKLRSLELDSRMMDNIWVPDLYFVNEKKASFHTVTVPNKLMHIYPAGRIQYSVRISATLTCHMDLRKYPLDTQVCSIIMESYSYSKDNVVFRWSDLPVARSKNLMLPQFEFGEIRTMQCDKLYYGINYTCISLEFELNRSAGYYITQVYIPSVLIVILSWVSFWLDIDAVPARISLGLLTVLTMTTQSAGARSALPRVSYVKAIDVWMATCLVFVFAALIEFAYVNVLSRVEKRRRETLRSQSDLNTSEIIQNTCETKMFDGKIKFNIFSSNRARARTMDKFARWLFPTVFIVFNIVYWFTYIFWEPDRDDIY